MLYRAKKCQTPLTEQFHINLDLIEYAKTYGEELKKLGQIDIYLKIILGQLIIIVG